MAIVRDDFAMIMAGVIKFVEKTNLIEHPPSFIISKFLELILRFFILCVFIILYIRDEIVF